MAKNKEGLSDDIKTQIKGVLLIALAAFAFTGLLFTGQTGTLGAFINNILRITAGETAMVVPLIILVFAARVIVPEKFINLKSRIIGIFIILLLITITFHLVYMFKLLNTPALDEGFLKVSFAAGYGHQGGGLIGALFSVILYYAFGEIASYIVVVTLAVISLLLTMNVTLTRLYEIFKRAGIAILSFFRPFAVYLSRLIEEKKEAKAIADNDNHHSEKTDKTDKEEKNVINNNPFANNQPSSVEPINSKDSKADDIIPEKKKPAKSEKKIVVAGKNDFDDDEFDEDDDEPEGEPQDFQMPYLALLSEVEDAPDKTADKRHLKDRAKLLEDTLNSFGVKARVINYEMGPTVTRFEVQPEVGVKVSRILSLADDIALNMTAAVVRIEAPIPGKAALGIEVPNKIVSVVHFREVLDSPEYRESDSPLTMALGKDITGIPVITSLAKMPHLLIAGSTGSGKSVSLNVIICSMLFKATPDEVKFLMIDPKMVELNVYNNIPHLITPVLTDPKKASLALKNMIKEMIRRYDLFASEGVRDMATYNEKVNRGSIEGVTLPYIVVIIDELADLMLVAPGEVEDSIARLSQMARAAGIHLIIATQRPSVDVLTGVIKANITSRIAFTVSSQVDSRTILDMAGAEKLLGRGDMLFFPIGRPKPLRVQSAFMSNKDIKTLTRFLKKQNIIDKNKEQIQVNTPEDEPEDELDALFPDAVELVVRTGQASISLLQRRFRIGYTRAARLIDDMEMKGIVGSHEGSKAREITVTPEEAGKIFEEYKKRLM